MKTYAKLEAGALRVMGRVPNISNPTDEQVAAYAAAHGFKELIKNNIPGQYYVLSYLEDENTITEQWLPQDLDQAKEQAMDSIQVDLDMSLAARSSAACQGFDNEIVYDQNALINAVGLSEGDVFIDAKDGLHTLTQQDIDNITAALKGRRQQLYAIATQRRQQVQAAKDVDELEQIVNSIL